MARPNHNHLPDQAARPILAGSWGRRYGNWPALAILLVPPAGVLIHRIFVEEAILTEVVGRSYTDYAAITVRCARDDRQATRSEDVISAAGEVASECVGYRPGLVFGQEVTRVGD